MSGSGVWPEIPSASLTVLLVALRGSYLSPFFFFAILLSVSC